MTASTESGGLRIVLSREEWLPKEVFEGFFCRLDAFVGQPLELGKVAGGDRSCGEVFAGEFAPFVEELVQFVNVVAGVGKVREAIERLLVAGVGEFTQLIVVGLADTGGVVGHILRVQPSS